MMNDYCTFTQIYEFNEEMIEFFPLILVTYLSQQRHKVVLFHNERV